MADDSKQEGQQAQEPPQGGEGASATDWKAEARKWQDRAQRSFAAEKELEELKASQAIEQEKANKRAEKAEAELSELKAKATRSETVARVADAKNVPAEFVGMLTGADESELAKQVERILELLPAYPMRTDDGGSQAAAKKTSGEVFADFASSMFKH